MKRLSIILNIILVIGVFGWMGLARLLQAIDRSECHPHAANLATIAEILKTYHADNGRYPVGMGIDDLRRSVEPKYIKLMPSRFLQYHSDGVHYDLVFQDHREGEVDRCSLCQLQIRDGV